MGKSHTWLEGSILESTGVEPEEKDHARDWEGDARGGGEPGKKVFQIWAVFPEGGAWSSGRGTAEVSAWVRTQRTWLELRNGEAARNYESLGFVWSERSNQNIGRWGISLSAKGKKKPGSLISNMNARKRHVHFFRGTPNFQVHILAFKIFLPFVDLYWFQKLEKVAIPRWEQTMINDHLKPNIFKSTAV